ncbi:MAG: hypothetical protein AAF414_18130 [Pseudomonadota bacterium]
MLKKALKEAKHRPARAVLAMGLALAATTWTVSAPASDRTSCEDFTVYSDGSMRTVTYVDHLPEGTSIGDQRIGYRSLSESDGNAVGDFRWILTVLEVGESEGDATHTSSTGTITFPEGSIFFVRLASPATDEPAAVDQIIAPNDLAIIGGSGAFEGARGTIGRDIDGVATTFSFDIECD